MTDPEFQIELSKLRMEMAERDTAMVKFIGCLFVGLEFLIVMLLWK